MAGIMSCHAIECVVTANMGACFNVQTKIQNEKSKNYH